MQELCKEGGVPARLLCQPYTMKCRVQSQACGSETVLNQTVSGNANTGNRDRHLGVVAHTCNPRTQETKAGRPRVQLCGESEASLGSLRLCLKTKQNNLPTKKFMLKSLWIFKVMFI